VGTEAQYNKYGTGAVGDGYTAPNAGYREPGYPAATAGAVGARESYANAATYDSAYPATGATAVHDSGYRTPTTSSAAYNPEIMQPGEIPARDYLDHSVHSNY
jgi:hypothetical protein